MLGVLIFDDGQNHFDRRWCKKLTRQSQRLQTFERLNSLVSSDLL